MAKGTTSPTLDSFWRVKNNFGVEWNGEFVTLQRGEPISKDHPLVAQMGKDAQEEHFVQLTDLGRWDTSAHPVKFAPEGTLEAATAAPGEKRGGK